MNLHQKKKTKTQKPTIESNNALFEIPIWKLFTISPLIWCNATEKKTKATKSAGILLIFMVSIFNKALFFPQEEHFSF